MIDVVKKTPHIYSRESRDYQALARIENAAYNFSKLAADNLANNGDCGKIDERFLDLKALTLGFVPRHNYDSSALRGACSVFNQMIRHKGTKDAIEEAVNVVVRSQNMDVSSYVEIISKDLKGEYDALVNIYIDYHSSNIINLTLIDDLMDYILPVGWTHIIYGSAVVENEAHTEIVNINNATAQNIQRKVDGGKTILSDIPLSNIIIGSEGYLPAINTDTVPNAEIAWIKDNK